MTNKLKIYTEVSSFLLGKSKNLSPLLSFHWDNLSQKEIFLGASNPLSPLTITSPEEADWFVLPMHWSYYLWNKKANMGEAIHLAKLARIYKKQLIVWFKGDLVPVVPFENAFVFLPGLVKYSAKKNQYACPVFVQDPMPIYGADKILYRPKQAKPSVGFCGYARNSAIKTAWGLIRNIQFSVLSRINKFDYQEVPIIPATLIRARVLRILSQCSEVKTNFIIRNKYYDINKNVDKPKQMSSFTQDYFANIYDNDYTLCLRGYGNWSYRFYETLACGRIPVFIDTDCMLPLSLKINWKKYCVWVKQSELPFIGEKIIDFHSSLSNDEFIELQIACRKLWEEQLTLKGFMNHFQEYLHIV